MSGSMETWIRFLRNPYLICGIILLLFVILFGPVMSHFIDVKLVRVGSGMPDQPPSVTNPLGTDTVGRDILAVMVVGTPLTLRIGLIAGMIGLGFGIIFGFLAGYFGGWVD